VLTNLAGGPAASVPNIYIGVSLDGTIDITGAINGSSTNTPVKLIPPTIVLNHLLRII
jgi:hypothetical protein